MYVTVPHPTLAPLTPLSRPSPHPTPRGFRRREAERAVLKDARHPEPRSRLGGRGVTLRRGRCQVCLFKGRRRVLGSVTMAWKLAVFVFMLWNQVGRQWRGPGPGLRGSGWEDPEIRGGRCAGARAPVRLEPAGGP